MLYPLDELAPLSLYNNLLCLATVFDLKSFFDIRIATPVMFWFLFVCNILFCFISSPLAYVCLFFKSKDDIFESFLSVPPLLEINTRFVVCIKFTYCVPKSNFSRDILSFQDPAHHTPMNLALLDSLDQTVSSGGNF